MTVEDVRAQAGIARGSFYKTTSETYEGMLKGAGRAGRATAERRNNLKEFDANLEPGRTLCWRHLSYANPVRVS